MKFILKPLIILAISLVIFSCNFYDLENIILDGIENVEHTCFDSTSNYYFRGLFGEDSICAYDGDNGYHANFGQGSNFVTLTPSYTSGALEDLDGSTYVDCGIYRFQTINRDTNRIGEEIRFTTPQLKPGTPLDSMVRAFYVKGIHPIIGKVNEDSISTEGFEIIYYRWYINSKLNPDHCVISCTSGFGKQPTDSYLNILDISLWENGDKIEGYIHVIFNCKLYYENSGDLDGSFATDFSGEFNLPISYKL